MKKLLLTLTVLTLLAACEAPVTNTTPGDVEDEAHFEESSEKVMAPQPFYIAGLSLNEDGTYRLTQQHVTWLSESEGTCVAPSPETENIKQPDVEMPVCNPNGFLIIEDDFQLIIEDIPASTPVHAINLGAVVDYVDVEVQEDGSVTLSMADLLDSFGRDSDFFAVTPFELEYGTVTVDGQEMSDQVSAIKEIYIP